MTSILMTTDTVGGVWTYSLDLADALARRGVAVTLAAMGRPMTVEQREAVQRSAVSEVHESTFPLEWMGAPWSAVDAAGEWLLQVHGLVRPDVVHLNGYTHAALPWRSPTVVVAHSCVLSWWRAVRGGDAPGEWDEYRRRVGDGLRRADAVVAPTAAMLDELRRCYRFDGGTVIPNGRRPSETPAVPKEPLILSAGRVWDDAKNVAAVDRVASQLSWPVAIAGETTHPAGGTWAPARALALGHLSQSELATWLARASLFVLPARYEPFGLGPLEAAHAGCALVLGDIPSLREVWGDDAVYVDPGDDDALRAACTRLTSDPDAVADLGHRARRRAAAYAPERMAASYASLYERLPVLTGAAS